ncbi:MAG TPA: pilus assembly protein PilM [Methylomirabilota bacterium]|nr:pilus assembly protein PilM [Methylomirabilota bacterium]
MKLRQSQSNTRKRKTKPPTGAVIIRLTETEVRAVRFERRGDKIVSLERSMAPLPTPEAKGDPAAVGAALKSVIEKAGMKGGLAAAAVPRSQLVLRTISLPKLEDESDLATVVQFQVGRDLPFRLDEAVIDFTKIEGGGSAGKMQLMVAAARRELVEFYQKVCESAGLKLAALTMQPQAHARAVQSLGETTDGATAFALVEGEGLSVDVVAGGQVHFSRNTPPIPEPIEGQGEPEFNETAALEIVRALHSYGGSGSDVRVTRVFVSASGGRSEAIATRISQRLSIPVEAVRFEEPAAGESRAFEVSAADVGVALAITDESGPIFDFLNPRKPAPPKNTKRNAIIALAAGFALLIVGMLGARTYLIKGREQTQRELTAKLAALEKNRKTFQSMIAQAKTIEDWNAAGKDWLGHYAYLSAALPPSEELYITSFSVAANGSIRMGVQARSGEILAKAEKQLRDAGYEVKPVAVTPSSDRFGYDFRSNIELLASKNLKLDLKKNKPAPRPVDDASLDPAVYKKGAG